MTKSKKKREWVRSFEVSEAQTHKMRGHMVYKVTSWLFPQGFPEASTKLVTSKRYSEFQKLHKALQTIHKSLYLSGTMPNFPKTGYFTRFDPSVLADRRNQCLELLEFAAKHSPLYNSQVFLNFFATTVSSPSSFGSDEDRAIGQLLDQGEIMEAAMASTNLAPDPTPVLRPSSETPPPLAPEPEASDRDNLETPERPPETGLPDTPDSLLQGIPKLLKFSNVS